MIESMEGLIDLFRQIREEAKKMDKMLNSHTYITPSVKSMPAKDVPQFLAQLCKDLDTLQVSVERIDELSREVER